MRIIAVIPARSGSKEVPDKNIKKIKNVPLIAFSLWSAIKSNLFEEIILSTDEPSYFNSVRQLGISDEYLRPKELAQDTSLTIDSLTHLLKWFELKGKKFDAVMILQPTAPFRRIYDLIKAINLLKDNREATCVTSVVRLFDHHPLRIKKILDEKWLVNFCKDTIEIEPTRRQDLKPPAFLRNGAIYLSPIDTIIKKNQIMGDKIIGIEMPEPNSINIDRHIDFLTAESMLDYNPYREYLAEFDEILRLYNE